jgi:hypothetical protein
MCSFLLDVNLQVAGCEVVRFNERTMYTLNNSCGVRFILTSGSHQDCRFEVTTLRPNRTRMARESHWPGCHASTPTERHLPA